MTSMDTHETSADIEREAEAERARLAMTLGQLRDSLTPQHIAEELLGSARHGASAVLKTLGETAAENPVPTLLISAACALLFSSGKLFAQSPSTDRHDHLPAPTNYAPPAYAGNKPAPERDHVSESRWAVLGEQPVVTAIVGIVIGAALAAILPRERSDDTLMSDKLDAVAAE
jgi:uncharacterized protein DUF3618